MTVYNRAETESLDAGAIGFPNLEVDPEALAWREEGHDNPSTVLRASMSFAGCLVNLWAFEVKRRHGCMELVDSNWEAGELWKAFGMLGHADTLRIKGRDYALFACPSCL
jgi:hypothetical protein